MTLLKVSPDTIWLPCEVRERFAAPADMLDTKPGETQEQTFNRLAVFSVPVIKQAIYTYEKFRHWRFIDRVPSQKPPARLACCKQILYGLPGTPLTARFEMSPVQGDSDDVHAATVAGIGVNNALRLTQDNMIDWVVVLHFIEPAIWINQAKIKEETPGPAQGFVRPEHLPQPVQDGLKELRKKRLIA